MPSIKKIAIALLLLSGMLFVSEAAQIANSGRNYSEPENRAMQKYCQIILTRMLNW